MSSSIRQLLPVYLVLLIWSISGAISVSGPVLPLYAKAMGIGIVGWSLLAVSGGLGTFLVEWIWGSFYDRFDRRLLMALSALCMTALYPLYTLQALIPYFIVLQFASGALGIAIGPMTRAWVSDESSAKSVGFFTSLWWVTLILGQIIGPVVGAYIAEIWSFEYAFYASALLSFALALLIPMVFSKRKRTSRGSQPQTIVSGLKSVLHNRSAGFLFLSVLFAFMGVTSVRSFLPLYASARMRMSTLEIGILISATSATQLIAMILLGFVSDRFGRKRMVLLGFGIASLAFPFLFLVESAYELTLVALVVSVGFSATASLLSLIPEVAPAKLYGTAIGAYGSFEDAGSILGSAAYGFIWTTYSPGSVFAAASLTQIVGALLLLPLIRKRT